ncbi:hypothetical protein B0H10DRAFT_2435430, partial [Mycena sp. CBHHK59/15]
LVNCASESLRLENTRLCAAATLSTLRSLSPQQLLFVPVLARRLPGRRSLYGLRSELLRPSRNSLQLRRLGAWNISSKLPRSIRNQLLVFLVSCTDFSLLLG